MHNLLDQLICSSTALAAMVKGLFPPLALSMIVLLPEEKDSDIRLSFRVSKYSEDIPSKVLGEIPIITGLDLNFVIGKKVHIFV